MKGKGFKAKTAADKKKLLKSLLRKRITLDAFADHVDESFIIIMNLGPNNVIGIKGNQRKKLKNTDSIAMAKHDDCINITLNLNK